jgi:peroxiredoxin
MVIKAGDTVPNVDLHHGFPPESVNVLEYTKGKKVVLLGLPGAFTPVSLELRTGQTLRYVFYEKLT